MDKSVLMINSGLPIGGTCVNVGCVPSKNLMRAAESIHTAKNNRFPGIKTYGEITDFKAIVKQKRALVSTLRKEKYSDIVKDLTNLRQIEGFARIVASHTVKVEDKIYFGNHILIATGAKPHLPEIEGLNKTGYLDNESAFELEELPDSIIVIGGRFIALEIGQMFSRLGSKVTILQRSERILPMESEDLTNELTEFLRDEGIEIVTGNSFKRITEKNGRIIVESVIDGKTRIFKSEKIIVAAGRTPNTVEMGLEEAGIALDKKGFVKVNEFFQTSIDSVFAAGDVIGFDKDVGSLSCCAT